MLRRIRTWTTRLSVRGRLTAAATAIIALLLTVAAVLLVWRVHEALVNGLDDAAQQEVLTVAAAVEETGKPQLPDGASLTGIGQIVDSSGTVVAASSEIEGEGRLFDFPIDPAGSEPTIRAVKVGPVDNAEYRTAGVRVAGFRVYVGLPAAEANRSTTELATALAVGMPILLALLAGLTWLYAGRALRPVDNLIARLDDSLQRQRQFVADAAHELRSPVAAIRAQLEVAGTEGGAVAEQFGGPDRMRALTQESVRLSVLVDDLLALARIDAQPELHREPMDLDDVLFAEARLLRQRTPVGVDTSRVTPVQIMGDPALLGRAVRNLLDNAARYAESAVTVALQTEGTYAKLTVADDGPGIPEDQRDAVLERFTRLDEARTRDTGGVGLGLAIVSDVVTGHHGRLEITDNGTGVLITICLPRDGVSGC